MADSWFKTGMKAVREQKEVQRVDFFSLKDGETVGIRFLSSEPVNIYEHGVKRGAFRTFTCLKGSGEDCPLCELKDDATINKRFVGAFTILDRRDGKPKQYKVGIRILRVLDKFMSKYGSLTDRDYELSRTGSGTATQYNFIPDDKKDLTAAESKLEMVDFKTVLKPRSRADIQAFLRGEELGSPSTAETPPTASEGAPKVVEEDGPGVEAEVVETGDGVRF